MASRSIVVIPPFIKYSAGPLLGPALLQSAARSRGHQCGIIDLNAMFIRPRASKRLVRGSFVGDHDKPVGPRSLSFVERDFMTRHIVAALEQASSLDSASSSGIETVERRAKYCFLSHEQVDEASSILADQEFGQWAREIMNQVDDSPDVIGISLLHAGQVIPSAAITKILRRLWPQTLIVWGGPHISGLGRRTLQKDLPRRAFAADLFVTGHAEETFVSILDDTSLQRSASKYPLVLDGKSMVVSPKFDDLGLYDPPLTLPAQSSIGCAYGKCSFCTYPSIEGKPQKLNLQLSVSSVVDQAEALPGSTMSLKDSLVTPMRLIELGECIQNRVQWSACTKLSQRLTDASLLTQLTNSGLATLEVGLETLLPDSQRRINKIQPQSMYEDFLAAVAPLPNNELSIVVNYMIGFPWEEAEVARRSWTKWRLSLAPFWERSAVLWS